MTVEEMREQADSNEKREGRYALKRNDLVSETSRIAAILWTIGAEICERLEGAIDDDPKCACAVPDWGESKNQTNRWCRKCGRRERLEGRDGG